MRLFRIFRVFACRESGVSLLETVVVLFVLGTVAVAFLSGLVTSSKANYAIDERATAESLAKSQMEWAQDADYVPEATDYSPAPPPSSSDYTNYSVNITAGPLHVPDDGIQKITVTVSRSGEQIFTLEGYKLDR